MEQGLCPYWRVTWMTDQHEVMWTDYRPQKIDEAMGHLEHTGGAVLSRVYRFEPSGVCRDGSPALAINEMLSQSEMLDKIQAILGMIH